MRYETLAELHLAVHRGDVKGTLTLDNDSTSFTDVDEETDPDWEHAETVFEMHPEEVLEQALDLLGIPHEHV